MAYKDDYYEEVDSILNKMKSNPFEDADINSVRYEDGGQIQPVGWVENADAGDGAATVKINANGITVSEGAVSVVDGSGNTVIDAGVVKIVNNAGSTVVINASGITITGGAISVTNGSGTVIIDGTSNMFKIIATGTQSVTAAAPSAGARTTQNTDTTLSGLGTFTIPPAHYSVITSSVTTSERRMIGETTVEPIVPFFASLSSGGASNTQFMPLYAQGNISTLLNGSNQCVVRSHARNYNTGAGYSFYTRYHILNEASI